ncbi:acetyl-CoA acetyltransferase [Sinobacterium caligoides]|uniref:Acetyl-CoA acetyltransferase n=1 Tax=Sinobacterium caligoides TaxID=933926 RepID=A0A3N2DZU7_9GAMM|nr:thiolase domain-containing protein [Sinobacterium caligoides]ROS04959.1 acetyl-CoA acetyltransferase [Sinobacterium caligoides]
MRDIAIVSFAQSPILRDAGAQNEVELIMPVVSAALNAAGLEDVQGVDFTCSGSCDYLQGASFAFVAGVDALGAVPPIKESHVEMDAAWALYESYLKIKAGQADSALIYGFAKSSPGDLPFVLSQQLDPYYYAPLWADSVSLAAMQARAGIDSGEFTAEQMAEVVQASRSNAKNNENTQLKGDYSVEQLLAEPEYIAPLRKHDCPPVSDGASAMVICTVEKAKEWGLPYAVISGIEHRIESHNFGARDLAVSESVVLAAEKAGVSQGPIDIAEIHAPFSHQELIVKKALGLDDTTKVNLSGGPLAGNLMMCAGLDRIGEVAMRIIKGEAKRGVAHATSGPCLQHNMVTVLEAS